MKKFYLVRHFEAENNLLKIDASSKETAEKFGLTKKGKEDAYLASKNLNFDLIISSPLRRARETAAIFAKEIAEVVFDDLLLEVDYGDFDGLEYSESSRFYKSHNSESVPFPGGRVYGMLD